MAQAPIPRRRTRRFIGSPALRHLAATLRDSDFEALSAVPMDALTQEDRDAYTVVRDYLNRYQVLPTPEAMRERGHALPDVTEPLAAYRDAMYNQIRVQSAAELVMEVQPLLEAGNGDGAAEAIARYQDNIVDPGNAISIMTRATLMGIMRPGAAQTVPTGTAAIDAAVGGVVRGGIWAIAGRPGDGKTFLQCATCLGMAERRARVLYVTKELRPEELMSRLYTMYSDINPDRGFRRPVSSYASALMAENWGERDAELFSRILVAGENVRYVTDIMALIQQHQPTRVLIDGTYFVKPTAYDPRNSRTETYEKLIRELRELALATNIPFGITWQKNRSGGNGTESLYGTDALSQDASLVLSIKRHRRHPELRELWVAKNRHGAEQFGFGVGYGFEPTTVGDAVELPTREDDRQESQLDRHTRRAIRRGRAPGAEGTT